MRVQVFIMVAGLFFAAPLVHAEGVRVPGPLCLGDPRPMTFGAPNADPERGTFGYVCQSDPETTQSIARPALLRAWVGAFDGDPERSTLGFTAGYGLREGDESE